MSRSKVYCYTVVKGELKQGQIQMEWWQSSYKDASKLCEDYKKKSIEKATDKLNEAIKARDDAAAARKKTNKPNTNSPRGDREPLPKPDKPDPPKPDPPQPDPPGIPWG